MCVWRCMLITNLSSSISQNLLNCILTKLYIGYSYFLKVNIVTFILVPFYASQYIHHSKCADKPSKNYVQRNSSDKILIILVEWSLYISWRCIGFLGWPYLWSFANIMLCSFLAGSSWTGTKMQNKKTLILQLDR